MIIILPDEPYARGLQAQDACALRFLKLKSAIIVNLRRRAGVGKSVAYLLVSHQLDLDFSVIPTGVKVACSLYI